MRYKLRVNGKTVAAYGTLKEAVADIVAAYWAVDAKIYEENRLYAVFYGEPMDGSHSHDGYACSDPKCNGYK